MNPKFTVAEKLKVWFEKMFNTYNQMYESIECFDKDLAEKYHKELLKLEEIFEKLLNEVQSDE